MTLTGLFAGGTMPLILELLAETTYPVPEGHTGNISTLLVQVFATVFGYSFNVLTTLQINLALTATGVVCTVLTIATFVQYRRLDVQEQKKQRTKATTTIATGTFRTTLQAVDWSDADWIGGGTLSVFLHLVHCILNNC